MNGMKRIYVVFALALVSALSYAQSQSELLERRYNLLNPLCVRNIEAYNEKVTADPSLGEPLPKIIIVIDEFAVTAPKTKEVAKFLKALNLDKRTLIVMDSDDVNAVLAARNIQKVSTMPVAQINTYDVVANAKVVLTKGAVEKIEEVYGA